MFTLTESRFAGITFVKAFKTISLPFFFNLILICFLANQTPAQFKSSIIHFKETNHDFGKVESGVLLTYEYKFTNEGEDTLVIKNVRASCGCTGATIGNKKNFGTNEEGEIKVTFNTSGRTGVQSKTVLVQTNDPKSPNVMLLFTCDIASK